MRTRFARPKKVRTSVYLPASFLGAMEIIRKEERILKSFQIELGLVAFFEMHKDLLAREGIDIANLTF